MSATATARTTTLTLARLHLNPTHQDVHRDLADPTDMHRTVMNLIDTIDGNPRARADANLLYRIDRTPVHITLLIQTTSRLHLDRLPHNYATEAAERDATPVLDWITEGRTVRYRIHANAHTTLRDPQSIEAEADRRAESAIRSGKNFAQAARIRDEFLTRAAHQAGKRRGIRIPLTTATATNWWTRTAHTHGLNPTFITTTPLTPLNPTRTNTPNIALRAYAYDGIATIANPDIARTALTHGIGQGRAYGLGLLSLASHTT